MQVQDPVLAQALASDSEPTLPPHLSPDLFPRLAAGATLCGGEHESFAVETPFTRQAFGSVLMGTSADVDYAVERARRAQQSWAKLPVAERAATLLRFHDLLLERQAEGLDLIQLETGKARYHAFVEYYALVATARYYAYHGPKHLRSQFRTGFLPLLTQTEVHHQPKGVVGIIAPWNYPLLLVYTDAMPALLAGNAIVVKPAEQTPFSALWGAQLMYEAGLPPELLHIVPGYGADAGAALTEAVDYVHFTGSTEVGRTVGQQAAAGLKEFSLELGGKNPAIIRHDADLEKTVKGMQDTCFLIAGQTCVSTERIYVHESLFDEFVTRFAALTEAMLINARYDFSAHMGSLASQEQLDKVTAHVDDAVEKGATVVTGGQALPHIGPLFYAPTLLTGVRAGMDLFREETFGPVVAIYPFKTDDEALALANDSAYGLSASVWTRDLSTGRRLAECLECGMVGVNDGFFAAWGSIDAPMGGFKASGFGRRNGPEGLLKYTEPQNVATQLFAPMVPAALGFTQEAFAGVVDTAFRLIKHIPGLR